MANNNQELIEGLRAAADFLESRPEFPKLLDTVFNAFLADRKKFIEAARMMGKAAKNYISETVYLRKKFGPVNIDINISREKVCERVQTGTRLVPETPAQEAVPAHEEPIFEWRCGAILGDEAADGDPAIQP